MIKNFFINLGFFAVVVTLPMPDENFITNPRLMINTRLFATVLEWLVFQSKQLLTKNDFVKASRGEFSKIHQINYSTVLPRLATNGPRLRWIHFNEKPLVRYILSNEHPWKVCLWGRGNLYHICFFFFLFLYLSI